LKFRFAKPGMKLVVEQTRCVEFPAPWFPGEGFLAFIQAAWRMREDGKRQALAGPTRRPRNHFITVFVSSTRRSFYVLLLVRQFEGSMAFDGLLSLPVSGVGSRPRSAEEPDPQAGRWCVRHRLARAGRDWPEPAAVGFRVFACRLPEAAAVVRQRPAAR